MHKNIEQKSDIVRKVQKLLALGKDKAAFANEASVALQMAAKLLEENGLAMKDIEMVDGHIKEDQFTEHETKSMMLWPWEKQLVRVVCELLPVDIFFRSDYGGYKSFVWCGTKADVVLAHELWTHLRAELKRLARPEPTPLEKRSFLTGATQELVNRAYMQRKAKQQATTKTAGTELMVVKKNQVVAWVKSNHTFGRSAARGSSVDPEAYRRGQQAGRSMNLGPKRQELGYAS